MASTACKSLVRVTIYHVKLHSETLAAVDRDRLVVDHSEQVLIGSEADDLPVETDDLKLVADDIKDPDFLFVSDCEPGISADYA